jgi:hypothetical protein
MTTVTIWVTTVKRHTMTRTTWLRCNLSLTHHIAAVGSGSPRIGLNPSALVLFTSWHLFQSLFLHNALSLRFPRHFPFPTQLYITNPTRAHSIPISIFRYSQAALSLAFLLLLPKARLALLHTTDTLRHETSPPRQKPQ